jgi:hypothetical protein
MPAAGDPKPEPALRRAKLSGGQKPFPQLAFARIVRMNDKKALSSLRRNKQSRRKRSPTLTLPH